MDPERDETVPEELESSQPPNKDVEEEIISSTEPDVYGADTSELDQESRSTGAEEREEYADVAPSTPPKSPRDSENSRNQETPSTPSTAPLSWQEAASSRPPSVEDPFMPSFTDAAMLDQLEINAKQTSANLVVLVHHLRTQLSNISSLSVQYMSLHKASMEGVSEHVHEGIAATQKLILKSQSLNAELKKIYTVQQDIKETKKMLGQLEKLVEKMTKH